jgi:hypothetical protein
MEIDPTKSKIKYEYDQKCKVLKTVKLSKFKKDKGDLIDTPFKASLVYNP